MFFSQGLLSRKGPLGAIWVAAYCFKKLKKSQVSETDISSFVDQILQEEWDVIAYRVLAYLLLGVVRIYSKKVEYLYKDCSDVLIKVKQFHISTKDSTQMGKPLQAPYHAITLPDRFELDAFDLEILEDVIGGNMVADEEITLKDTSWGYEEIGYYSLSKYHCNEVGAFTNNRDTDGNIAEDYFSSHLMASNVEASTSHNLTNTEDLQVDRLSGKEYLGLEVFGEDRQGDRLKAPEMAESNNETCKVASTGMNQSGMFSREENFNTETASRIEREKTLDQVKSFDEVPQIEGAEIMNGEMVQSENINPQLIHKDHNGLKILERSVEKLLDNASARVECMVLDMSCGLEESADLVKVASSERDSDPEQLNSSELTSAKKSKFHDVKEDHRLSISIDATPQSKLTQTSGSVMHEVMAIPTPANKERPRTSAKRKCIIDDLIVLPNEIIRSSINDARDLVSKRRKAPHTALSAWKSNQISGVSHGFSEPLIFCDSVELRSLFSSKQHVPKSGESEKFPEKPDVSESPYVNRSGKTVMTPETLAETVEPLQCSIVPESPNFTEKDQVEIAPETPVQCSTSMRASRSPWSPKVLESDDIGRTRTIERMDKVTCLGRDREPDLGLMIEDMSSCGDELELDASSGRTSGPIASYLHRHFMDQKKQGREEVIELLPVLQGRTKEESARLFYEILVLKSKWWVDVKQDYAYSDIIIQKLPKWDQIFESSCL